MDEVMAPPSFDAGSDEGGLLARETGALAAAKKLTLFAAGVASQRFMAALEEQQEMMAELADMIAQVYALESVLLRQKLLESWRAAGRSSAEAARAMTGLLAEETMTLAEQGARRVVAACAEGDMLRTQLAIVRRVGKYTPADGVGLGRAVAGYCVRAGKYPI
jgi:alkylation response protein AidB-like acyl-CoA dehydrogenase